MGFFPRKAVLDPQRPVYDPFWHYKKGLYNLVLTKGTFMDVRAFNFYSSPQYAEGTNLQPAVIESGCKRGICSTCTLRVTLAPLMPGQAPPGPPLLWGSRCALP